MESLINEENVSMSSELSQNKLIARKWFSVSLCNFCRKDLANQEIIACNFCGMTYYCDQEHIKLDTSHTEFCNALRKLTNAIGKHIFANCNRLNAEEFRTYRMISVQRLEAILKRPMISTEREIILFPRLCINAVCKEFRYKKLTDCKTCGQVAFCNGQLKHLDKRHSKWCKPYKVFKKLINLYEKCGSINAYLPSKILKMPPIEYGSTMDTFNELNVALQQLHKYISLSQISTYPLTAWYALKFIYKFNKARIMNIHVVGSEFEFEINVLYKWEIFLLHILPICQELNIIFIGPELKNCSYVESFSKRMRCCYICKKMQNRINFYFDSELYHTYCSSDAFIKPNLVCFFNDALYRSTPDLDASWSHTINAAVNIKCPILVTSYTAYEAPLDLMRFMKDSNRYLNIVLPPTANIFTSEKPERNFISDESAPFIYKNYYCFILE